MIVPHARGAAAHRRLTLAMLFAGFATFSLLYVMQPGRRPIIAAVIVGPGVTTFSLVLGGLRWRARSLCGEWFR